MTTESSAAQFSLRLPAQLDQLPVFLEHVRRVAQTAGLSAADVTRLELAVEEALVNVFHYAYAQQERPGPALCRVSIEGDGVSVAIIDQGPAFDPLARPDPNTALELEQRQPGGLGIFMIRQLTDEVRYCREDGQNVLTIRMRKSSASGSP